MKITSPAFKNNEAIPTKYTCDGEDVNPPLNIDDLPKEAKELAMIMDDPDAPSKTWVHWVVYNMPVNIHIDENSIPGKQGMNDFGKKNYGGPCPPSGEHRYYFKVYALDNRLELEEGITKKELESAMEGHILEQAELVGLYAKS
ncbi:YbhB/YbcL family Raf kinase inhibitor-like protein [candidate division KSB1 bacterium]|nr:YbhB/YbcL family Raf kinase inhibitor-like protein [candidate division KSB1 bacterium]